MNTTAMGAARALRVCLLCVLASALFASAGCRTRPYRDVNWDDLTGRKRDHADLDADYEKCRAVREEAFLRSEGASRTAPDMVARASSDTAFLSCMERSGWKPRPPAT